MTKVTTIGGGGGHAQILQAIRDVSDIKITAICPSTDSGGSTGILRKEYGGNGYLGDVTKCIVSLCQDRVLADALMFRYEGGPLDGHSVKNLLFLSLMKTKGFKFAVKVMGKLCELGQHRVVPVTNKRTELCARLRIGNEVLGEANIDRIAQNPLWNPAVHSIKAVYLRPAVRASSIALNAIKKADYLIICPGDLYSSIIPTLLPTGVRASIRKTKAKIIIFLNIMTKKGETDNYTGSDFIKQVESRLGRTANYIICNSEPIPRGILLRYSLESKIKMGRTALSHSARIMHVPLAYISPDGQILSNPRVIRKAFEEIINSR